MAVSGPGQSWLPCPLCTACYICQWRCLKSDGVETMKMTELEVIIKALEQEGGSYFRLSGRNGYSSL